MRKSNRLRIHDEKERWGESSFKKKSDGGRLHHEKKSNGVRVHREKDRWGESLL